MLHRCLFAVLLMCGSLTIASAATIPLNAYTRFKFWHNGSAVSTPWSVVSDSAAAGGLALEYSAADKHDGAFIASDPSARATIRVAASSRSRLMAAGLTAFDRNPAQVGSVGVWSENDNTTRFSGLQFTPQDDEQHADLGQINSWRTTMKMLATFLAIASFTTAAHAQQVEWAQVDDALSRKATVSQDDVHRYSFPRTDLKVTLDGVAIKPALALGGWVAFKPIGKDAMLMGDLVLTESEINPMMAKLLADGLQITAVHNHLLRASPATFYMHVGGHGDPVRMALALRDALVLTKTPSVIAPATTGAAGTIGLDTAALDNAIGAKGKATGGVYQFSVPRTDTISDDGMDVPPALGSAHGINFQPTGDGQAAITGDFIALSDEVVPLITALRNNDIEVTAIHNHMLDEQPRTFFIHFWANDDAQRLAKGIRAALQTTKVDLKQ